MLLHCPKQIYCGGRETESLPLGQVSLARACCEPYRLVAGHRRSIYGTRASGPQYQFGVLFLPLLCMIKYTLLVHRTELDGRKVGVR